MVYCGTVVYSVTWRLNLQLYMCVPVMNDVLVSGTLYYNNTWFGSAALCYNSAWCGCGILCYNSTWC